MFYPTPPRGDKDNGNSNKNRGTYFWANCFWADYFWVLLGELFWVLLGELLHCCARKCLNQKHLSIFRSSEQYVRADNNAGQQDKHLGQLPLKSGTSPFCIVPRVSVRLGRLPGNLGDCRPSPSIWRSAAVVPILKNFSPPDGCHRISRVQVTGWGPTVAPTHAKSPQSHGHSGDYQNGLVPILSGSRPNTYVYTTVRRYCPCERTVC